MLQVRAEPAESISKKNQAQHLQRQTAIIWPAPAMAELINKKSSRLFNRLL
jgi:hypothetical protein